MQVPKPKSILGCDSQRIEGFEGHHRTYKLRNFTDKSRKIVTDNHDNANILYSNYHQDCNHEATLDPIILDEIPQKTPAYKRIDEPTMNNEAIAAIKKMHNDKSSRSHRCNYQHAEKPIRQWLQLLFKPHLCLLEPL